MCVDVCVRELLVKWYHIYCDKIRCYRDYFLHKIIIVFHIRRYYFRMLSNSRSCMYMYVYVSSDTGKMAGIMFQLQVREAYAEQRFLSLIATNFHLPLLTLDKNF